jgi:hypothetical protein
MTTGDERRVFEVQLRDALAPGHSWSQHVDRIRQLLTNEPTASSMAADLDINIRKFVHDGQVTRFRLHAKGTVNGEPKEKEFEGECRFSEPRVDIASFVVRPAAPRLLFRPPSDKGSQGMEAASEKAVDERKPLIRWAWVVATVLVISAIAGLIGWFAALRRVLEEPANLLDLTVLTAAVGWTAGCGAALRSLMDRYRNGYEFDSGADRVQWPPRAAPVERFSTLIAPTFLGRPLLGAIIGPVTFLTLRIGALAVSGQGPSESEQLAAVVSAMAIAGLAGMFAKSIWDNLNERAKDLFK